MDCEEGAVGSGEVVVGEFEDASGVGWVEWGGEGGPGGGDGGPPAGEKGLRLGLV